MSNPEKLEFRLVATQGVTRGKGYRAEWVRKNEVVDMDAVIAEAQAKGAFSELSVRRVRSDLETLFDTMIENALKDGRVRKLDGYLELALKIHGNFDAVSDDFDPARHTLDLGLKPLSAFRRATSAILPVNVNRVKQFRLSYITAADGLHKNHEIVYGQPFVIRGSNLTLPDNDLSGVHCQVLLANKTWLCATTPILEKSDREIRCAWPEDYGPETQLRSLWAGVTKAVDFESALSDANRTIYADILCQ